MGGLPATAGGASTVRLPPFHSPSQFAAFAVDARRTPDELEAILEIVDGPENVDLRIALALLVGREGVGHPGVRTRLELLAGRNFAQLQRGLARFSEPERVADALTTTLERRVAVATPAPAVTRRLVADFDDEDDIAVQSVLPFVLAEGEDYRIPLLDKALLELEIGDRLSHKVVALRAIGAHYSAVGLDVFLRILNVVADILGNQSADSRVKEMALALLHQINASPPNIIRSEFSQTLQAFFRMDLGLWEQSDPHLVSREALAVKSDQIDRLQTRLLPHLGTYQSWKYSVAERQNVWDRDSPLTASPQLWSSQYPPWYFMISNILGVEDLKQARALFAQKGAGHWKRSLALAYYSFLIHLHREDKSPFLNREEARQTIKALLDILEGGPKGDLLQKLAKALYPKIIFDQLHALAGQDAGRGRLTLLWAKERLADLEKLFPTPSSGWEEASMGDGSTRKIFVRRAPDPVVSGLSRAITDAESDWKAQVGWTGRLRAWWSTRGQRP